MSISRTLASCLALILLGCAPALPQAGGGGTRTTPQPGALVRNRFGMEMVYIPAGSFLMGSPSSEVAREPDEEPQHQVTIGEGFYMGRYEVTQAQWRALMGRNPSYFRNCGRCPVEGVSWNDARAFIRKLNARRGRFTYRLPTEAEWEYACRAGTTTPFAFGSSLSSRQANFNGFPYGGAAEGVNRRRTTTVGSFRPNAWGLYDMHGNVWEWCEDWHNYNYDGAPADGSAWLSVGLRRFRVLRGGSWNDRGYYLRSAERGGEASGSRRGVYGFRIVAVPRTPSEKSCAAKERRNE